MYRSKRWPFNVGDVLRSMSDAVITIDADKRITSMNAAAEAMTGIAEAEAVGMRCGEVVRSQIWSTRCPFKAVWDRGETVVNFNVVVENRLGARLPVSICTSLLKNEAGEKIGAILSLRDIRPVLGLLDALQQNEAEIAREKDKLRGLQRRDGLGDIMGRSPQMQEIFDLIQMVAKSDVTVLIQGESGTGKELIASTIHALGHRASRPIIKVSCAALPETLLESELFGHVRGAFTGAIKDRPGRFELAASGTIFLDDVGEISPSIQVKLLRVLQEREFERVGGTRTLKVDVRVIAASNRDLHKAIQEGSFREDLFYRLNVVPITVPPLRERKEDIPLLVAGILEKLALQGQRNPLLVSPGALRHLLAYNWPGNVRELENALEFAQVRTEGETLLARSLPPWVVGAGDRAHEAPTPLGRITAEREREEIIRKLVECHGKVTDVANALGVGRTTLWRKMKRYHIAKAREEPVRF
jgi:PAS domain S-box-containing protein